MAGSHMDIACRLQSGSSVQLKQVKSGHNNTRLRDGPRAVRRSDLGFLTVMAFNLEHAC